MSLHPRDAWNHWKKYTDARIGLGRSGRSQRTQDLLAFELAFAKAKDSLLKEIDWNIFQKDLDLKLSNFLKSPSIFLESQAKDLNEYLTRPDLGRKLSETSITIQQDTRKLQIGIAIT
ncbi:MAG: ethanolamine ammonia-lyase light chain EutC, partial [Leptospiraceae bacterium]|nr:ethanolamine ammonia-lyase light chain EutC [Leptospiraceae bacterium]